MAARDEGRDAQRPIAARCHYRCRTRHWVDVPYLLFKDVEIDIRCREQQRGDAAQHMLFATQGQGSQSLHGDEAAHRVADEHNALGLAAGDKFEQPGQTIPRKVRAVSIIDIKAQIAAGRPGIFDRHRLHLVIMDELRGAECAVGKIIVVAMHEDQDFPVLRPLPRKGGIQLCEKLLRILVWLECGCREIFGRVGLVAGRLHLPFHMGRRNADIDLREIERLGAI